MNSHQANASRNIQPNLLLSCLIQTRNLNVEEVIKNTYIETNQSLPDESLYWELFGASLRYGDSNYKSDFVSDAI